MDSDAVGAAEFIATVPASNSFATLNARVISLVKTEEYNPYSVSFAFLGGEGIDLSKWGRRPRFSLPQPNLRFVN
jgi:hypothetical protein